MTWDELEKLFREQHFSKCYSDNKAKEFYELIMSYLISDEYVTNFLEMLRYVPYIKYAKTKIQRFISGFPMIFRDKSDLLEPQTMKDVIKKIEN